MQAALADCLMRPGEHLPDVDPFPAWDTYGIDDMCEHGHQTRHLPTPADILDTVPRTW